MSQLMALLSSHFRRLITIWTLFDSMSCCLQIRHSSRVFSFKDLGVVIGLPWRAASNWTGLVSPSLPLLGLDLPLLFSVI